MKHRVLFLCTHNSCRSQMAEGLVNHDLADRFQAFSAGTEKTRVKPLAARVLEELGIDTSPLYSKTLAEFDGERFDHVITLCGDAREKCPLFFGGVIGAVVFVWIVAMAFQWTPPQSYPHHRDVVWVDAGEERSATLSANASIAFWRGVISAFR